MTAKVTNEDLSLHYSKTAAKIAHFNSVNSEIIGRKLTTSVHDVGGLLPFNYLKATSRFANPLSNAAAMSKSRSWRSM